MADESSGADETAAQPASGIRQIVWIRQVFKRWQSTAAASAARRSSASGSGDKDAPDDQQSDGGGAGGDDGKKQSPAECGGAGRRVQVVTVHERGGGSSSGKGEEEEEEEEREPPGSEPMTPMTPDAPVDVPRGCCAVYVGAERRRFVVPTAYLGMPVFRRLLEKAEEEFGFEYRDGALTIPCDTEAFKYILVVMDRHQKGLVDDEGNPTTEAGEGESSENRE